MTLDEKFFYDNAGFSYDPKTESQDDGRIRCARRLANAEQSARNAGISFQWEIDQFSDSSDFSDDSTAWQLWSCVAYDQSGDVCGSLGGVDFGRDGSPYSNPYRRVIEAEIAVSI